MSGPSNSLIRPSSRLISILARVQNFSKRIAALRESFTSASKELPLVYEQRHKEIFPPGFDRISSSASAERGFYPFSLERLYNMLINDHNPNNRVESIIVKSASYCKQTKMPEHEFILIEVEDIEAPGLKNVIVLDRNNGNAHGRTAGALASIRTGSSPPIAAKDEFRVAYDGNKSRLLSQCGLDSSATLEEIDFRSGEPFLLYQLATLAWLASVERERYQLIGANCYWFAGLIWDCMKKIRPTAGHKNIQGNARGKFRTWFRQATDPAELAVVSNQVEAQLPAIELKFTKLKQQCSEKQGLDMKQQLEAKQQEIEELRRRLGESP